MFPWIYALSKTVRQICLPLDSWNEFVVRFDSIPKYIAPCITAFKWNTLQPRIIMFLGKCLAPKVAIFRLLTSKPRFPGVEMKHIHCDCNVLFIFNSYGALVVFAKSFFGCIQERASSYQNEITLLRKKLIGLKACTALQDWTIWWYQYHAKLCTKVMLLSDK